MLFETKRLIFEEAEEEDIATIIDLESHPNNKDFLWIGTYEEHLEEMSDDDQILGVIKEKLNLDIIGYCLIRFDRKSDVFELRRIAISSKGKGYGKESMEGLFDFAFNKCHSNRFWLDVYPDNIIGIKLYEGLGMHRDGVMRQSDKTDRGYLDQIIYSILKEEFKKEA